MTNSYALIRGSEGTERFGTIRTINVEGERALPIFASVEAAEDFLFLSGHGPEWEVADGAAESLVGLLREKVAPHIRFVTIDPPAWLRGGEPPAVELIPIERFIEDC